MISQIRPTFLPFTLINAPTTLVKEKSCLNKSPKNALKIQWARLPNTLKFAGEIKISMNLIRRLSSPLFRMVVAGSSFFCYFPSPDLIRVSTGEACQPLTQNTLTYGVRITISSSSFIRPNKTERFVKQRLEVLFFSKDTKNLAGIVLQSCPHNNNLKLQKRKNPSFNSFLGTGEVYNLRCISRVKIQFPESLFFPDCQYFFRD